MFFSISPRNSLRFPSFGRVMLSYCMIRHAQLNHFVICGNGANTSQSIKQLICLFIFPYAYFRGLTKKKKKKKWGRWIRRKEAVMEKQVFLGGSSPSNDSSPVFASESLAFCISLERRNFSCMQWWTIAITRTTLPSEQQMSEGQKGNRVKSKLKLCRAYFEFYSVDLRRITWKLKWKKMSHMYWPKMCFNDTIWLQPFHPP